MTLAGDWLSGQHVSHLPNGRQCAHGLGHRPGSVLAVGVGPALSPPYFTKVGAWSLSGLGPACPGCKPPSPAPGPAEPACLLGCRLEQAGRGDESTFEVGPGPPAVSRPKQPFLWPLGPPSTVPAPWHACHNSCAWDQQGHVPRPNLTEEVGRRGPR